MQAKDAPSVLTDETILLKQLEGPYSNLIFTIINTTNSTFSKVKTKQSLSHGWWRREPDDTLGPDGTLSAVVQYRRIGLGPKGGLTFEVKGEKVKPLLLINYNIKHLGKDKLVIHCSSESYTVHKLVMKEPKFTHVKITIKDTPMQAHSIQSPILNTIDTLKLPLLVLINSNSGGKQGKHLFQTLTKLLPKYQIVNILQDYPHQALERFKNIKDLRIICAGGDGTAHSMLEEMDKIEFSDTLGRPPVALLPLGTANDIARVFGWGSGYNGEKVSTIIKEVMEAKIVKLDRWEVKILSEEGEFREMKLNNYLSLGYVDAQVALDVHMKRKEHPDLFFHRKVNKLWYSAYGAQNAIDDLAGKIPLLNDIIDITVDGAVLELPEAIEGMLILNISQYSGGMLPWGSEKDEIFTEPSMSDGLIEVIGFRNIAHLTQIGAGWTQGVRLAQARDISIRYKPKMPALPMKVDGEPWLQEKSCRISVGYFGTVNMLAKAESDSKSGNEQKTLRGFFHKHESM